MERDNGGCHDIRISFIVDLLSRFWGHLAVPFLDKKDDTQWRPYTAVRSKMTWRMTQMMRLMTSWPAWSPADPIFGPPTIRVFWAARSADNSGPCQLNQKEYIYNSRDVLIFYHLKLLQENSKNTPLKIEKKLLYFILRVHPCQPYPFWPGHQRKQKVGLFSPLLPLQSPLLHLLLHHLA